MTTYLSVCSGIEAATVAWHHLGWKPVGFAEIEAFPSAVLAHHYPSVQNFGDMTELARRVLAGEIEAPDILVGGTPCQAFSVAGLRAGLADPRGALTLAFQRLANAIDHVRRRDGKRPCTIVWENVPGVLSSKDNAFGCFLGALVGEDEELQPPGKRWADAGAVYGPERSACWRILDAQYFGLAQRRRRVFVVASAGVIDPCSVLFESDRMRRDSAPRREAGQSPAGAVVARAGRNGGSSNADADAGHLIAFGGNNTAGPIDVATARNACASASGRMDFESETFIAHTLRGEGFDASEDGTGRSTPLVPVAFTQNSRSEVRHIDGDGGIVGALAADAGAQQQNYVAQLAAVRRLTPRECERLQGFPDDYTLIPWRGGAADACPDGPRYKALGNSMAVPVMRWIGGRLAGVLL